MIKKIIYLIFLSALLISFVESIYLFNYVNKETNSGSETTASFFKPITSIDNSSDALNNQQSALNSKLNEGYWKYLHTQGRDELSSVNATVTCKGTIIDIRDKPGVNPADNLRFEKGIRLKDATTNCEFIILDARVLKNTSFIQKIDGKDKKISFEDLKIGDGVISTVMINLLTPRNKSESDNAIQTTITKL